jgi:hypothetical protein
MFTRQLGNIKDSLKKIASDSLDRFKKNKMLIIPLIFIGIVIIVAAVSYFMNQKKKLPDNIAVIEDSQSQEDQKIETFHQKRCNCSGKCDCHKKILSTDYDLLSFSNSSNLSNVSLDSLQDLPGYADKEYTAYSSK